MRADLNTSRQSEADRRQESTDRLLAAGIDVIAERGFARTTLGQIGARAGYSRETVRLRHGSKLELLETALSNGYEAVLLAPTQDPSRNGLEQVLGVSDALSTLYRTDPMFLRVVYRVYVESISVIPELHDHTVRWMDQIQAAVAGSLRRGIADGSVRPDLDCADEALHWIITAVGLACRHLQRPDEDHAAHQENWKRRLRGSCGA